MEKAEFKTRTIEKVVLYEKEYLQLKAISALNLRSLPRQVAYIIYKYLAENPIEETDHFPVLNVFKDDSLQKK